MDPANSQQALAQLQQTQASAQNPAAILAAKQQAMGLPAAQETVTGLRGAINNTTKLLKQVAPSIMGRTANSLVTQAQATRQIGNESAPLQETLGEQGQNYSEANADLDRLRGDVNQAASLEYGGQQDRLSYLQNLYNTLYGREQDAQAREDRLRAEAESRRAAASQNSYLQGLLNQSASSGSSAPGTVAEGQTLEANLASRVNTLRQLASGNDGVGLATAIQGLRKAAAAGDQNAKLVAQQFYKAQGIPVPKNFVEFF